jgi:molecular chaperone DnaK
MADAAKLRSASERLGQAAMKLGEAAYQQQPQAGPAQGAPGAGQAGRPDDRVVDAEFEDVDPSKKKPS